MKNTKLLIFIGVLFCFAVVGVVLILMDPQDHGLRAPSSLGSQQVGDTQKVFSTQQKLALPPGSEQAFVKRTVDGDTLDVIVNGTQEKVRLLGINSPESVDPHRPVECFGKEASRRMDALVTSHAVTMAGDATNANRDKYKRLLRYIYLENGTFVNAWMVQQGFAFAYTRFPFVHETEFVALERTARAQKLGLWNSAVCAYDKTQ